MALHWSYNAAFYDATQSPYVTLPLVATIGVRDQIRFLIQDTLTTRQLLYDEEIDWTQTQEMNAYMMAARCCDMLVIRRGPVSMKKVGTLTIEYDLQFYTALASDLRSRGLMYQTVYVGGISIADKIAQEADPDWVRPRIGITTFDNPDAEQPSDVTTPDRATFPGT
jgi:hypothetical protein